MREFTECAEIFELAFRHKPTMVVRAPGRVNLMGDHTDYNGGFVLPMALRLSAVLAMSAGLGENRGKCRFVSVDRGGLKEFPLFEAGGEEVEGAFGRPYIAASIDEFFRRFPDVPKPRALDILVQSSVPDGVGLSSSAAICVAMVQALAALTGQYLSVVEVARIAQAAEHNPLVGVRCGIMDQMASVACQPGCALLLDCTTLEYQHIALGNCPAEIVIMDSGVTRRLSDGQYNLRRQECQEALEMLVAAGAGPATTLRDISAEQLETHGKKLPPNLRYRAAHVISENARTIETAALLEAGDAEGVGRLFLESHASMRDYFEASCHEMDFLVSAAMMTELAFGCRMTGGGFGGCAVALIWPGRRDEFICDLDRIHSEGFEPKPEFIPCEPSEGMLVITYTGEGGGAS